VLDWRGVERFGEGRKNGFPGDALVRKHPHFDEAVGVQRRIDLLLHGGREPVGTDHHHRVEVMGFSAVFLALGGGQLNRGHPRIIANR